MILDRLITGDPQQAAHRRKGPQYAQEKIGAWEHLRQGLLCGSQDFVDQRQRRHLNARPETDRPQRNRLLNDSDPPALADKTAAAIGLALSVIGIRARVLRQEKGKRGMLGYYLWDAGRMSNQRIASLMGVTHSNISPWVAWCQGYMGREIHLVEEYNRFKSPIED